jgi:hypothetical protein
MNWATALSADCDGFETCEGWPTGGPASVVTQAGQGQCSTEWPQYCAFMPKLKSLTISYRGHYEWKSCFISDTQITMGDGTYKSIVDVVSGDIIKTSKGTSVAKTRHEFKLGTRHLYSINGSKPFVTADHPFFTKDGWRSIIPEQTLKTEGLDLYRELSGALEVGQFIKVEDGSWEEIRSLARTLPHKHPGLDTPVYTIEMESGEPEYFANGKLAHNQRMTLWVGGTGSGFVPGYRRSVRGISQSTRINLRQYSPRINLPYPCWYLGMRGLGQNTQATEADACYTSVKATLEGCYPWGSNNMVVASLHDPGAGLIDAGYWMYGYSSVTGQYSNYQHPKIVAWENMALNKPLLSSYTDWYSKTVTPNVLKGTNNCDPQEGSVEFTIPVLGSTETYEFHVETTGCYGKTGDRTLSTFSIDGFSSVAVCNRSISVPYGGVTLTGKFVRVKSPKTLVGGSPLGSTGRKGEKAPRSVSTDDAKKWPVYKSLLHCNSPKEGGEDGWGAPRSVLFAEKLFIDPYGVIPEKYWDGAKNIPKSSNPKIHSAFIYSGGGKNTGVYKNLEKAGLVWILLSDGTCVRHAESTEGALAPGTLPAEDKKEASEGKCTIRRGKPDYNDDTYVHAVMVYYGHPKITTTPPKDPPTVWPAGSNWFPPMNYYNASNKVSREANMARKISSFDTRYSYIKLTHTKFTRNDELKDHWWHWPGHTTGGVEHSNKGWPWLEKYEKITNGRYVGHLIYPSKEPDWPKAVEMPPWKTKWVTINYRRYRISVEKFGKSYGAFESGTTSFDEAACPGPNSLECAQKTPDGPWFPWPGCGAIVTTDKKTALLRHDTTGIEIAFDDIQTSFENTSKLHTSFVEKIIKGTDEIVNNLHILSSTDKEILAAHFGIEPGVNELADSLRAGLLTEDLTLSELIDADSEFADAVPVYFEDGVIPEKLDKLTSLQYAADTELSKITTEEKTNNTAVIATVRWQEAQAGPLAITRSTGNTVKPLATCSSGATVAMMDLENSDSQVDEKYYISLLGSNEGEMTITETPETSFLPEDLTAATIGVHWPDGEAAALYSNTKDTTFNIPSSAAQAMDGDEVSNHLQNHWDLVPAGVATCSIEDAEKIVNGADPAELGSHIDACCFELKSGDGSEPLGHCICFHVSTTTDPGPTEPSTVDVEGAQLEVGTAPERTDTQKGWVDFHTAEIGRIKQYLSGVNHPDNGYAGPDGKNHVQYGLTKKIIIRACRDDLLAGPPIKERYNHAYRMIRLRPETFGTITPEMVMEVRKMYENELPGFLAAYAEYHEGESTLPGNEIDPAKPIKEEETGGNPLPPDPNKQTFNGSGRPWKEINNIDRYTDQMLTFVVRFTPSVDGKRIPSDMQARCCLNCPPTAMGDCADPVLTGGTITCAPEQLPFPSNGCPNTIMFEWDEPTDYSDEFTLTVWCADTKDNLDPTAPFFSQPGITGENSYCVNVEALTRTGCREFCAHVCGNNSTNIIAKGCWTVGPCVESTTTTNTTTTTPSTTTTTPSTTTTTESTSTTTTESTSTTTTESTSTTTTESTSTTTTSSPPTCPGCINVTGFPAVGNGTLNGTYARGSTLFYGKEYWTKNTVGTGYSTAHIYYNPTNMGWEMSYYNHVGGVPLWASQNSDQTCPATVNDNWTPTAFVGGTPVLVMNVGCVTTTTTTTTTPTTTTTQEPDCCAGAPNYVLFPCSGIDSTDPVDPGAAVIVCVPSPTGMGVGPGSWVEYEACDGTSAWAGQLQGTSSQLPDFIVTSACPGTMDSCECAGGVDDDPGDDCCVAGVDTIWDVTQCAEDPIQPGGDCETWTDEGTVYNLCEEATSSYYPGLQPGDRVSAIDCDGNTPIDGCFILNFTIPEVTHAPILGYINYRADPNDCCCNDGQ